MADYPIPPDIEVQLVTIQHLTGLLARSAQARAMEIGGYSNASHVGDACRSILASVERIREGLTARVEPEG